MDIIDGVLIKVTDNNSKQIDVNKFKYLNSVNYKRKRKINSWQPHCYVLSWRQRGVLKTSVNNETQNKCQ